MPTRPLAPRSLRDLDAIPVTELETVTPTRAGALEQMGIETVLDLLTHFPRRYIDRTAQVPITDLVEGTEALVLASVRKVSSRPTRNRRPMVEIDVWDGSSYLHLTFFNQPWRAKQLREGMEIVVWGKVERYRGRRQMTNPLVDLVGDRTGRVVPVYPQSEKAGLTSDTISRHVAEAVARFGQDLVDPLPAALRDRLEMVERAWAVRHAHLPEHWGDQEQARRRLGFDELLRLQLILVMRKRAVERESAGIRHSSDGRLVDRFFARLPFPLTNAQQRAVEAVRADLAGPHPMHRLLQGDVGSGKTVVAVAALLTGVEGGYQGALMAPTEVLAEQHFQGIRALLDGLEVPAGGDQLFADRPLRVELLTNRVTGSVRTKLARDLAAGDIDIVVGTHALLVESVDFARLGVVVIDEQHRFGVEQRAVLREKGGDTGVPDVLVMTATPIPRTAAMTVFGDLDTTILDELPPGRTPVTTVWARGDLEEAAAWEQVRTEVAAGRQAYVVCPLVEGSERVQARSATEEYERLAGEVLAGLEVGLVHGQMPAAARDEVMAQFRAGGIDVLVATTVIEVGVDVPNATVMVVEDADRFGIAQLHQLRGRVGRGAAKSFCYLLADDPSGEGEARLQALVASTDGFELAEVDLELRGEGTILGTRQKGATDLKLASLRRHKRYVALARDIAFELVDADPTLADHADLADEVRLLIDEEERAFLFRS
ncbi:MAG TPA: ATP-dependent DNA helicase RecG [Acidimicrobiales bacterium]|nr:ATP-dependent DNA helicase RecG [Acidimicrobiales bacterium]